MREKRTARAKAHIFPSMYEQLELLKEEAGGKVLSMSDYLFGVIQEHIEIETARRKSPIRVSHLKLGRRVGQQ